MKKKILIIASHPDDEVLGCGGTICKLTSLGNEVNVFFLSDGVSSRVEINKNLKIKERKNSAYQAAQIMGVRSVSFGNFSIINDIAALLSTGRTALFRDLQYIFLDPTPAARIQTFNID